MRSELLLIDAPVVDILTLKAANIVPGTVKSVKVYLSGDLSRAVSVQGLLLTKGARAALEAAGGKIVE